jgi:hypothetical protein
MQNVILTFESMAALNSEHVLRFFNDAQKILIPAWVSTDSAWIAFCHLKAYRTEMNLTFQVMDGFSKCVRFFLRLSQDKKGQPCRGLLADAREFGQMGD